MISPAPEARQIIAHGETVGIVVKTIQAPVGATENQPKQISFAPSGARCVLVRSPTVSPWATFFRRSATTGPFCFRAPQLAGSSAIRGGETFAGFQKGFQAGEHARPAAVHFAGHRRTRLELVMRHREAHGVLDGFNLKRDARFVFEVVRVSPRQHEAFGWTAFQNFARNPSLWLLARRQVLPGRTLLPVRGVRVSTPILTGEFRFGDGRPHIFRRRADIGCIN